MAREHKPRPVKVSFWIRKSPAYHVHNGPPQQMKEAVIVKRTRVTLIAAFCSSIVFIGALSVAKAQSGIASIYSGGQTANGERADANGMTARSQNSSVWNAGARHSSAQWPLGNRPNYRPRSIRAWSGD